MGGRGKRSYDNKYKTRQTNPAAQMRGCPVVQSVEGLTSLDTGGVSFKTCSRYCGRRLCWALGTSYVEGGKWKCIMDVGLEAAIDS